MAHIARTGEIRNAYTISVGIPEGKRLLGEPRSTWEVNMKMYLTAGCDSIDWIQLTHRRVLVNTFGFHKADNFLTMRTSISVLGRPPLLGGGCKIESIAVCGTDQQVS